MSGRRITERLEEVGWRHTLLEGSALQMATTQRQRIMNYGRRTKVRDFESKACAAIFSAPHIMWPQAYQTLTVGRMNCGLLKLVQVLVPVIALDDDAIILPALKSGERCFKHVIGLNGPRGYLK